ncbi:MAG TPA: ADP-forming succinate--CoA ligase subunit beta [Rhabdochlamydiaceae bacterium]|nr:ADP-forming succinate--CoA ligase subunit beta [Rhabdochlamydiaceae bacterium]
MNLHEYQAKELLVASGVPVPPFGVASKPQDVEKMIHQLHLKEAVIKIQVHAGGRGKAGGVKFAKTPDEILQVAKKLIGMKMVNNQTGSEGVIAHQVLIASPVDIEKEYYLGAIVDRNKAEAVLIASPEGGMEIEEIAAKHPDKILTVPIGMDGTVKPYHLLRLGKFMGWEKETLEQGMKIAAALGKLFIDKDASLLEINPLVKSNVGQLWALDAKLSIDDNALYRHPELMTYYDPSQQSPNEVAAKKHDLAYIALEGNIGCMVNGAGLAMATMDIIKYAGGKPANFLDVGGSATAEKITEGFKILVSDPQVKAILVNIFGGIMNCATIAEGILAALKEHPIKIPLVVRMEGTNVEQGKKMLEKSGLKILTADNLTDAATVVVKEAHADSHR